jgi:tetratricopeptide (TPR) repeat protein
LAKRAVELAGNESTCLSILSQARIFRRSFDLVLQHIQRAIEINPANQWNTADMGNILTCLGRTEEALPWFDQALRIDPYFDPPRYRHGLGRAQMMLRRCEEAVTALKRPSVRPFQASAYLAGCQARMKATGRARLLAAECLQTNLNSTINSTIARRLARLPFKNPADAAHLSERLRAAGLPQ